MIRTLSVFQNYCALNSREPLTAFVNGARKHGIKVVNNSFDADAVLIWSVLFAGRMAGNQSVYEHYRKQNRPVFIIDVGALRRNVTWKVALNHVTNQGLYGHDQDLDINRPAKLGLSLKDSVDSNEKILIAAQHAKSLQMTSWTDVETWINYKIVEIKSVTDRPIVVRPHPRSSIDITKIKGTVNIELPQKIVNSYDDFDFKFNFHAVVNHNSGPGIQAALNGVRPIVDASSLAFPVAVSIDKLDQQYNTDRERWLIGISHTEYTVKEIDQGYCFERLRGYLNE